MVSRKKKEDFDLSTYVPQVGDTILYYPSAHKEFLKVFPDVLGQTLKDGSREPLWQRAENERNNNSNKKKMV